MNSLPLINGTCRHPRVRTMALNLAATAMGDAREHTTLPSLKSAVETSASPTSTLSPTRAHETFCSSRTKVFTVAEIFIGMMTTTSPTRALPDSIFPPTAVRPLGPAKMSFGVNISLMQSRKGSAAAFRWSLGLKVSIASMMEGPLYQPQAYLVSADAPLVFGLCIRL